MPCVKAKAVLRPIYHDVNGVPSSNIWHLYSSMNYNSQFAALGSQKDGTPPLRIDGYRCFQEPKHHSPS